MINMTTMTMTEKKTTQTKKTGTIVVSARKGKVNINWPVLRRIQNEGPLYIPTEEMGVRRN
jgi:hypothetical protein